LSELSQPVKLLALDLDGTLISDDLVISPRAKAAIQAAQERGVIVTLATGRMFYSAQGFARELNLTAPLVVEQGALVRDRLSGQTIFHLPVPFEVAREFIAVAQERGLETNVSVNDALWVDAPTEGNVFYSVTSLVPIEKAGNLLELIDRPELAPTKLVIVTQPKDTLKIMSEFQETFAGRLYVSRTHPRLTEAVHPGCNKGVALEALAKSLAIPLSQVMAIGDNLNDLPMFDYAGLGVAVANASDGLKEKAGYVTQGRVAEGVVEAIERFILAA
jgi:Cof subfamily protein (haloacid dehalogenase superfamily)